MLCAMYFAQGVPWGFMVTPLISYLTARGLSVEDAGWLTGIVLLPWTFKLIWAPLIDTFTIPAMGRRRPWIIGAELMMAVSLLGILGLGNFSEALGSSSAEGGLERNFVMWLGAMFFVHNCFASMQDVCTDALAVDVLPPSEQGRVNGLMWGSKLVGKAVGMIVMAWVMTVGDQIRPGWGIPAAVIVQFVILIGIMMFPLLMLERPGERRYPWSEGEPHPANPARGVRNPLSLMQDLRQGFTLLTTFAFFAYGLFHVLGWGIVEVITKTLYTQRLGWTFEKFSYVSGAGIGPELAGAVIGGVLADRWGRRSVMLVGFGLYGMLHLMFAAFPALWHETWFTSAYLVVNPGALAMGAVGFLSMGMKISWTKAAATMFTIYMTLSNVGHVAGNWISGELMDRLKLVTSNQTQSYSAAFAVAGIVTILPLLLLVFVNPADVDARRKPLSPQVMEV